MSKKIERHGEELNLRAFLSQTFVVYMKTYALHWNYEGSKFHGVHVMTEMQYRDISEAIDELAERMRAMGNAAPVSLTQILEHSSIKEFKTNADNDDSIRELAQAHRNLSELAKRVANLAEDHQDSFTHDILVQRSGTHDKFAWMLESLIQ